MYMPTGHEVVHIEAAEAPVAIEYVPAPQLVHVATKEAPVAVEYLPAMQSRHVATKEAPVAVEYLPALQSVHATEPVVVLYFPAAQAEHVPPSGPVNPRLQTQLVDVVDPATDCEFAGQLLQGPPRPHPVHLFAQATQQGLQAPSITQ
jgi:hypothetical protein